MNCEICGTEIKGQPFKTKIDNSVMITCKECSKFGKVQNAPQRRNKGKGKKGNNRQNTNKQNNKTYQRPSTPEYEVIDDYGKVIKQAREKQKLTREKLAIKIYEKESVLAHIEKGKMIPDSKIARKLEKALNIKLIEKVENDVEEHVNAKRFREATIGDIAKIKRSK